MVWGAKESREGMRQVRFTSVRIWSVHERAVQLGGTKLLSTAAVSTSHGSPPTVTMFWFAVNERACPWIVMTSPWLAVRGDVFVSTGVMLRAYEKVHPLGMPQTADSTPEIEIKVSRDSTAGGGGGGAGWDPEAGKLGGGGEGEGGGGDGGEREGGTGGGDGARRMPQSAQSVPVAHSLYSAPCPPSSHTPSLTHPC